MKFNLIVFAVMLWIAFWLFVALEEPLGAFAIMLSPIYLAFYAILAYRVFLSRSERN
jgi:uncharacterized membrane protein YvlD (DUF360 family)